MPGVLLRQPYKTYKGIWPKPMSASEWSNKDGMLLYTLGKPYDGDIKTASYIP